MEHTAGNDNPGRECRVETVEPTVRFADPTPVPQDERAHHHGEPCCLDPEDEQVPARQRSPERPLYGYPGRWTITPKHRDPERHADRVDEVEQVQARGEKPYRPENQPGQETEQNDTTRSGHRGGPYPLP